MKSAPPGRCEARPKTASVPVGAGFGVLGGVFADAPEKSAEERAALVGQETRVQFRVVVEPGILEEIHEAAADARLGVVGAEVDLGDPGEDDGAGAHRARFERDVEFGAFQAPALEVRGRLGDRQDFGMGGGVLQQFALVVGLSDDLPIADNDATDGHLADVHGALGFTQGVAHVSLILVLHNAGILSSALLNVKLPWPVAAFEREPAAAPADGVLRAGLTAAATNIAVLRVVRFMPGVAFGARRSRA